MKERYTVVMGDVIESRTYDDAEMMNSLKAVVAECNRAMQGQVLSPYTYSVTTGDEFQGVAASLAGAAAAVLFMEEYRLREQIAFGLRYVVYQGEIGTPINPQVAHEMTGPALIQAHELLQDKRRGTARFRLRTDPAGCGRHLEHLFKALDEIMKRWSLNDYPFIYSLIREPNNAKVARTLKRDRSLVYRRRKHLLVTAYTELREAITAYARECDN